ncbi:hypothetical protein BHYA_0495g00030 [Botrytis hyacinthi]|uniref:O-methyltransferase domain-containing protein n=1 Tax=Botrytis hyacinthi TaxID=278943 RepID=A0A4Z1G816_9HELO|nr:hypothetical protein BHYA_0495g00030 [Botrytis hyacinthi]
MGNLVVPSKEHKWWLDSIDHTITPECRRLLEKYSKISPEDVRQHIYNIREKAWAIRPYPCGGLGRFLDNLLAQSPAYKDIVVRFKGGDSIIDIGCFLGQELRQLAKLLKLTFFEDDMLQPREKLKALHGTMDVILVNRIFHQWNLENQIEGATLSVKLSRDRPGSLILGYQAGVPKQRELLGSKYRCLLQSPETWKEVWDEVGKRTGTQWKTESRLLTWEQLGYDPKETAYVGTDVLMEFVITRE